MLDFLDMMHTLHVNTAPAVMFPSFSFVYIPTISLYISCISFIYIQFMPHIHRQGSLEDMRAHVLNGAEALKLCINANISVYPEMTSFSPSWQFFRVNWIPTSFSSCFTVVRAERMALYIRRCFSFCLDYMHLPYNEDKLNHTSPSSIIRISFLL